MNLKIYVEGKSHRIEKIDKKVNKNHASEVKIKAIPVYSFSECKIFEFRPGEAQY